MKYRNLLIAFGLFLIFIAGIIYWRNVHKPAERAAIHIKKKAAVAAPLPARAKEAALPAIVKSIRNPKVAIVIDDFGYNMNNVDPLFGIGQPVTLSILPNLSYSKRIAESAHAHGYETILHLPLESHRKDVKEEFDTIKSSMSDKDILAKLNEEIASVPGLKGVSNHMGSKGTEDKRLMAVVFGRLKKDDLYFLDSLTSQASICRDVAFSSGIRCAKRDLFLDNTNSVESVKRELLAMRRLAFKRGRIIAVCHDRKNTIAALKEMMPMLARDGIEFVPLSKMVK